MASKKEFIDKDLLKRTVIGPEGEEITVDPIQDYFCDAKA